MNNEEKKDSPFDTMIAVLIAAVTVIGAIVAWRASVIQDASGDEDYSGLRASINVEETRALNTVGAYANYGAYTNYWRNQQWGDLLAKGIPAAPEEEALLLESQRADAHDLARASKSLFPSRFVNRDGSYAVKRQLNEMWTDAARELDLSPEPQFVRADILRGKSSQMLGAVVILALALVSYTLVESVESRWKHGLAAVGSVFAIAGVAVALVINFSA